MKIRPLQKEKTKKIPKNNEVEQCMNRVSLTEALIRRAMM